MYTNAQGRKMPNIVFRPKYSLRYNWDVFGLNLLMLFSIILGIVRTKHIAIEIILLFILFDIFMSRNYIRRIIFSSNSFIVKKYVWPTKEYLYTDIVDIGNSRVKTRQGTIHFSGMDNYRKLRMIFAELTDQRKIDPAHFYNSAILEEKKMQKILLPALLISFILDAILYVIWPFHHSTYGDIPFIVSGAVVIVIVFLLVQLIYDKKRKNQ